MPHAIVLGDTQVIFRTGAARVLSAEPEFEVVAECQDEDSLKRAVDLHRAAVFIFVASMVADLNGFLERIERCGGRAVVIGDGPARPAGRRPLAHVWGLLPRSVSAAELVHCIHLVIAGERVMPEAGAIERGSLDRVGVRVLERLTPKELQILALAADGATNKEIARRLSTKEQVVKNYLWSIYDKTGVSDRLELSLFTHHHAALATAAVQAREELERAGRVESRVFVAGTGRQG